MPYLAGVAVPITVPDDVECRPSSPSVALIQWNRSVQVLTFPLYQGRSGTPDAGSSQRAEKAADAIAEYMNRCLLHYGFALSPSGAAFLPSLVSEVLGNAEDHSRRRHWWLSGYLRQPREKSYGDCHITIFNFGRSLSDSLSELPPESMLAQDIGSLLRQHERRFTPRRWEPENLRTVYALQEGVSRHNTQTDRIGHRGKGTADLISFFQRLGHASDGKVKPRMCLVSGRTHILFDGRYEMKSTPMHDGEKARVIAFNNENDLRKPPDSSVVRWLPRSFPGTLISLRFFFDPQHLTKLKRET